MTGKITLELTEEEAEWLATCLSAFSIIEDPLSRSGRIDLVCPPGVSDLTRRMFAKLALARAQGKVGMDPDEWLAQAQERLAE